MASIYQPALLVSRVPKAFAKAPGPDLATAIDLADAEKAASTRKAATLEIARVNWAMVAQTVDGPMEAATRLL